MHDLGPGTLQPGQTEAGDYLRLHLTSEHDYLTALGLTDERAAALHDAIHADAAPGLRHPPRDRRWDFSTISNLLIGGAGDRGASYLEVEAMETLWNHHLDRVNRRPATAAPAVTQRVVQYEVTIMPDNLPDLHVWTVVVKRLRSGAWIVKNCGEYAAANGDWLMQVSVSDLPADFFFTEEQALNLAHRLAPALQFGEMTATEKLAKLGQQRG